jgi:tetratricopeptide (TPR) repeat protein
MSAGVGGCAKDEQLMHALHLRPRSRVDQRRWWIGRPPSAIEGEGCIRLDVRPDCHESFVSIRAILRQLRPLAPPSLERSVATIEGLLSHVCPDPEAGRRSQIPLVNDAISFAMTRRISRESVYTARIVDQCAQLLNAVIAAAPHVTCAYVRDVDRLDRPTIKVLARAMLLLESTHRFSWLWHFRSAATLERSPAADRSCDDLFALSRNRLFRQLLAMLQPTVNVYEADPSAAPHAAADPRTVPEMTAALVLQNYDACLLWLPRLLDADRHARLAGLRMLALVAANIGQLDGALAALGSAERLADTAVSRAHLCYLQGLLEAKRRYDLSRSTAHYERGLDALSGRNEGPGDIALERAWLLNGLALNDCLMWRRGQLADLGSAFAKVREAFRLVRAGEEVERTYLRFNLLANSAFLLEMQDKIHEAIGVLHAAFDMDGVQSIEVEHRLKSTLLYRIGVLLYRAGDAEAACDHLERAAAHDAALQCRPTQERILRALGMVWLERSASRAQEVFADGLALCRSARFSEGTVEHARGLAHAHLAAGRTIAAQDLCSMIEAEEGVEVRARSDSSIPRPVTPSSKLPAYVPEVDLEDIPAVDLNRYLVDLAPRASQSAGQWSH